MDLQEAERLIADAEAQINDLALEMARNEEALSDIIFEMNLPQLERVKKPRQYEYGAPYYQDDAIIAAEMALNSTERFLEGQSSAARRLSSTPVRSPRVSFQDVYFKEEDDIPSSNSMMGDISEMQQTQLVSQPADTNPWPLVSAATAQAQNATINIPKRRTNRVGLPLEMAPSPAAMRKTFRRDDSQYGQQTRTIKGEEPVAAPSRGDLLAQNSVQQQGIGNPKKSRRQNLPSPINDVSTNPASRRTRPAPPAELNVNSLLSAQPRAPPAGIRLPYASLDLAKALPSADAKYLPDTMNRVAMALLSNRPRMALRGVHIVVHDVYAKKNTDDFESAYGGVSTNYLYPSQWDQNNTQSSHFSRGTRVFKTRNMLEWTYGLVADRASAKVEDWYYASATSMAEAAEPNDFYQSRCFTIDIDPTSYATKQRALLQMFNDTRATPGGNSQKENFADKAELLQYAIDERAFRSFLAMLNEAFPLSADGNQKFDLINESESKAQWQYAEQSSRRYAVFMDAWSRLSSENEGLKKLTSHNAFLSAVHWFLRNQWSDYDSMVGFLPRIVPDKTKREASGEYRKNFFIEVIGFATADEWQQSQHDFSLSASRHRAWQEWQQRVRTMDEAPYDVHGFFAIQNHALAPYATYSIKEVDSTSNYYDHEASQVGGGFIGSIIPVAFKSTKKKMPPTGTYLASTLLSILSRFELQNTYMTFQVQFFRRLGCDFPLFLTQNALNPFITDVPFRRDEFGWLIPPKEANLFGSTSVPKMLGIGGYGQVIRVRYQHSTQTSHQSTQKVYHHAMILDMLKKQRLYLESQINLSKTSVESARIDLADQPSLQSLIFQTLDAQLAPEKIDFSNANTTVQVYDMAIEIIEHLISENQSASPIRDTKESLAEEGGGLMNAVKELFSWGSRKKSRNVKAVAAAAAATKRRELLKRLKLGYSADIRIGVAVKYGQRHIANRVEAMIAQLCHLEKPITVAFNDPQQDYRRLQTPFIWETGRGQYLCEATRIQQDKAYCNVVLAEEVPGGRFVTDFPCPSVLLEFDLAVVKPKIESRYVMMDLTTEHLMRSYGTGYDNQFCFMVMPLASKGSLKNQIDMAQAQYLRFVAAERDGFYAFTQRSAAKILEAKEQMVKNNRLPPSTSVRALSAIEMVQVLKDAVSGIRFLNAKGIAHSDIKPDNILVDGLRRGTVTDFGLARPYGVPLGGIYGTPGFWPAKFERLPPSFSLIEPFLDTFAFGVVLNEILRSGYGQASFVRLAGTSFTGNELRTLLENDPTWTALDFAAPYCHYRDEDQITPQHQRPLSQQMASHFVATLKIARDVCMDDTWTDKAIQSFDASKRLDERRPSENIIVNRLLAIEFMLDRLQAMLIANIIKYDE